MTDVGSKLGKLNKLKESQNIISGKANTETVPAINQIQTQEKGEAAASSNEPVVTLTRKDLENVVEAKAESKLHKQTVTKVKKKESEYVKPTHTTVNPDLSFEVGLLCKKNKVFQQQLNDHLYEKMINDKDFLKTIVTEIKEKKNGETRG